MKKRTEGQGRTIEVAQELLVQQGGDDKANTWTLATRLGDMLHLAEELFGPRDSSYTILGIEFADDGPRIWYPKYREDKNDTNIIIKLSPGVATNAVGAYHELAHETVHSLAPVEMEPTTYFEEGVACYFADYYIRNRLGIQRGWSIGENYECALSRIRPLLDKDKHCVSKLRDVEPSFSKMGKELIGNALDLCPEQVEDLKQLFNQLFNGSTAT